MLISRLVGLLCCSHRCLLTTTTSLILGHLCGIFIAGAIRWVRPGTGAVLGWRGFWALMPMGEDLGIDEVGCWS